MKTHYLAKLKKTAFSKKLNLLFFAALLFSQIVFALHYHNFQDDIHDFNKHHECTLCSQLQASSHGLTVQQLTYFDAFKAASSFIISSSSLPTVTTLAYSPRAPPIPSVS